MTAHYKFQPCPAGTEVKKKSSTEDPTSKASEELFCVKVLQSPMNLEEV